MRWGAVCGVGGGIFAKTAKTPPLQSGVGGDAIASQMPPIVATMRMPCRYVFYHDAARRVATVFEKWNCVIEIYLRARRENPPPKKIDPMRKSSAAVSFWNTAV